MALQHYKNLYFHICFDATQVCFFCFKQMKTIHTKKSPLVLNVILLNNADSFFTAIWCYPSPFGIIERMVFSRFELCFEVWTRCIFIFIIYNTLRAIVALFPRNFSCYIFGWIMFPFSIIFIYKRFTFCYSLWMFSNFFMICYKYYNIFLLMVFIVSFLFFIQLWESIHDQPWFGYNK